LHWHRSQGRVAISVYTTAQIFPTFRGLVRIDERVNDAPSGGSCAIGGWSRVHGHRVAAGKSREHPGNLFVHELRKRASATRDCRWLEDIAAVDIVSTAGIVTGEGVDGGL